MQIERRLLDIFVVFQRRNRLAKFDSDHNYHEYILHNWTMYNLSLNRKEVLVHITLPTGYTEISLRLAADVIARHVRANEIEVNTAHGRNPKKNRMYA